MEANAWSRLMASGKDSRTSLPDERKAFTVLTLCTHLYWVNRAATGLRRGDERDAESRERGRAEGHYSFGRRRLRRQSALVMTLFMPEGHRALQKLSVLPRRRSLGDYKRHRGSC